jgi:hypothetical protein
MSVLLEMRQVQAAALSLGLEVALIEFRRAEDVDKGRYADHRLLDCCGWAPLTNGKALPRRRRA